jgi:hypothetical protein
MFTAGFSTRKFLNLPDPDLYRTVSILSGTVSFRQYPFLSLINNLLYLKTEENVPTVCAVLGKKPYKKRIFWHLEATEEKSGIRIRICNPQWYPIRRSQFV